MAPAFPSLRLTFLSSEFLDCTLNMSPSAIVAEAASVPTNGLSVGQPEIIEQTGIPPYVSTMPSEEFDWKVSLKNKVIAITGANRGIGS